MSTRDQKEKFDEIRALWARVEAQPERSLQDLARMAGVKLFDASKVPTAHQIGAVALLCTKDEWARLCATPAMIDACADSLERIERVASQFTGREIRTGLSKTSVDQSL